MQADEIKRQNKRGEEFVNGNYLLYYYSLEKNENSAVPEDPCYQLFPMNDISWDCTCRPEN